MWLYIGLLSALQWAACMMDAEKTEWNRFGYLVKVLSEDPSEPRVIGCTGTLITPSLVLTASKCIASDKANSIVIYAKGPYHRKRAVGSIIKDGVLAVLEIHPIKDEMCPRPPAPRRLSRLPIKLSLTNAPWERINLSDLSEADCRITGFETVNGKTQLTLVSVANFSSIHATMRTPVHVLKDGDTLVVDVSSGSPVCWDDLGLPLECLLDKRGWTQVGLLHSVTRVIDDPNNFTLSECDNAAVYILYILFSD
ncbi:hypothetical protein NECAME_11093 [Necator americanus]|uniref:Peptidase S1 domain-containing protein n=1 Tax=Necator americanus TaxID=51031 RepID=W2T5T9_NECAM|nr:hypothetical protein NECAME_11093 [Necator americanus]ETN77380.1 hypothetical protein NECAME_11093 [Necator americanus]